MEISSLTFIHEGEEELGAVGKNATICPLQESNLRPCDSGAAL